MKDLDDVDGYMEHKEYLDEIELVNQERREQDRIIEGGLI